MSFIIHHTEEMLALGKELAQTNLEQCVIYLQGPLGAGKTTLVRGILRGLGYQGAVKSPTYTLVEPYHLSKRNLLHWDMYRLRSTEELENIGIRDYLQQTAWWLIEWPEQVYSALPPADLIIALKPIGEAREITLTPKSEKGDLLITQILEKGFGK